MTVSTIKKGEEARIMLDLMMMILLESSSRRG